MVCRVQVQHALARLGSTTAHAPFRIKYMFIVQRRRDSHIELMKEPYAASSASCRPVPTTIRSNSQGDMSAIAQSVHETYYLHRKTYMARRGGVNLA